MRNPVLLCLAFICLALTPDASLASPKASITDDSAISWQPTPAQQKAAFQTAAPFFAALDAADYPQTFRYALMSPATQALAPCSAYRKVWRAFTKVSGPLQRRNITHLGWTSGSTRAPDTGTCLAMDAIGIWQNVHLQGPMLA